MTAPFIQLFDGSEYFFDGREQPAPKIVVIAHSLACINRFAGHTFRPYSVAEHSCLCYEIARKNWGAGDPELLLACLLHDIAECVTGDLSSPLKRHLRVAWTPIEYPIETHLFSAFGVLPAMQKHAERIKHVDLTALWLERRDLMLGGEGLPLRTPWDVLDQNFIPLPTPFRIRPDDLRWGFWRDRFLDIYSTLTSPSSP